MYVCGWVWGAVNPTQASPLNMGLIFQTPRQP